MSPITSKHEPITTLSSRIAWTGPWYSVRQDQILLPNGRNGEYNEVARSELKEETGGGARAQEE